MANLLGNDGDVTIGANIVAEINDWSLNEGVAIADDTVLGDTTDTHKPGTTNWSGTVNGYYDDTDTTGQEAMTVGASVDLHLRPEGAGTGNIDLNGAATITSIDRSLARNSIVAVSFAFQGNGALTRTVLA